MKTINTFIYLTVRYGISAANDEHLPKGGGLMSQSKLTTRIKIDPECPFLTVMNEVKERLFSSDLSDSQKSLFEHALKRLLDLGDLIGETTSVYVCSGTTGASHLLISLYPSNSFTLFLAALAARDVDMLVVKNGH